MITLFEAAAARRLRIRPMETTATTITTNGVASLPSDFLGLRRVTWTGSFNVDLDYMHPSEFIYLNPFPAQGTPQIYTLESNCIKINPLDDSGLEIVYYAKPLALSGTLNSLFQNHPDVYLFGTLAEANFFNKGSALPQAAMWKQRRDEVFDEIQMQEFRERSKMAIGVSGNTP
jgi:hypothetical protein